MSQIELSDYPVTYHKICYKLFCFLICLKTFVLGRSVTRVKYSATGTLHINMINVCVSKQITNQLNVKQIVDPMLF